MWRRWLVHWLAAVMTAAGCGEEPVVTTPAPPPPPPPPAPQSVTATIEPAGGTVDGPDGIRLVFPSGAVPSALQITIARDAAGAPAWPGGTTATGPTFALTPHGVTFGAPVTIRMPMPAGNPGAVLLKSNREGAWEQPAATVSNGVISAAITGFSWVGVVCCFPGPQVNGPTDIGGVPEGGFWIFNVGTMGKSPFRYQWYRGSVLLPGETASTLLINPVQLNDDGALFSVQVTDADGIATTSRSARLGVVAQPPVIVTDPADLSVVEGASANFAAQATSSIPQTVQWERSNDGGQTWTAIPQATAAGYTLTNAHLINDNDARFRMVARNASPLGPQPVASRPARLTVTAAPVAPSIVVPPRSVTVTAGSSATFTVVAAGTSLGYQWERAPAGGAFAAIANATSASVVISNAGSADHQAAFRVRVSNTAGAVTSAAATLDVLRAATVALVRVAGGAKHSVALRGNGTLVAWGKNGQGQLGDGTTLDRASPASVTGAITAQCTVATFAVGWKDNLALCGNGDVWAWGGDEFGELGLAAQGADVLVAQRTPNGPARHVAAARGSYLQSRTSPYLGTSAHSLAALANNPLLAAWGANDYGQLGDGLTATSRGPGLVAGLANVIRVAAGVGFSVALRSDGSVWTWGVNGYGQLGQGTTAASLVPAPVQPLRNIIEVVAGDYFALALDRNGAVFAWGDNQKGQLGDGTQISRSAPVAVTGLPRPVVGLAAGSFHVLALLDDGSVYAWGANGYGALGVGPAGGLAFAPTPQRIPAPLPAVIVAIGAGADHSLAVDANYDVWSWGRNDSGQLGDGTLVDRAVPARVPALNIR